MQTAGLLRADSEVDMAARRSTVSFSCENNFIFDKLSSSSGEQSKLGTSTTVNDTVISASMAVYPVARLVRPLVALARR